MSRSSRPVLPTDRVAQVLARDASLVEVFVRHSPQFDKLRHAALRRVMARLVTIEQAAQVAEIPVAPLVADLNRALGMEPAEAPRSAAGPIEESDPPPGAPEVELDVREDLRRGEEPFTRITAAVNALRDGEVLRLRAPFKPAPLIQLLARRGYAHQATCLGADDWVVRLFRAPHAMGAARSGASDSRSSAPPSVGPSAEALRNGEVWLDVTGLEPPEPLVRTLAALERLAPHATLVQVNVREPQHLFPMLRERGFTHESERSADGRVLTRIRRARP